MKEKLATLLWKGNLQGKIYSMGDPSFIVLLRKSVLQRFHGLLSLLLLTSDNIPQAKYLKLPRLHQGITQTGVNSRRDLKALEEENKLLNETNLHLNSSQWNGFFPLVSMGCVRWESFPISATSHPLTEKLSSQNTPGVDQKTCFASLQFLTHPQYSWVDHFKWHLPIITPQSKKF